MDGIIVVNKPKGITSRDVVNKACKLLNTKKIGHTGTLDPIATGVLVLCVGKATKLVEVLTKNDKEYIGTENITGSDKIGASCTRLISIVNKNPILEMTITKNRYGKSGKETKCIYNWNPDINTYTYIQNIEDINNDEETKQETEENKENFKSIF